ncbi:MAG TPA: hypothetical protein VN428_11800 [Bryobacteraceae bacterium]|nr:hypothetical protein [Bryobacteraceae bacterium]
MRVRVETYSGYKADERPVRFHMGDSVYEVESVDDQWYSPGASWFRVKASDGNIYILRHDSGHVWTVQSFRSVA